MDYNKNIKKWKMAQSYPQNLNLFRKKAPNLRNRILRNVIDKIKTWINFFSTKKASSGHCYSCIRVKNNQTKIKTFNPGLHHMPDRRGNILYMIECPCKKQYVG